MCWIESAESFPGEPTVHLPSTYVVAFVCTQTWCISCSHHTQRKAGPTTAAAVVVRCHGLMPRNIFGYVRDHTIFGTKITENGSFVPGLSSGSHTYVRNCCYAAAAGPGCWMLFMLQCSRSNGYAERAVAACLGSVWKLKGSLNISVPRSSRSATFGGFHALETTTNIFA